MSSTTDTTTIMQAMLDRAAGRRSEGYGNEYGAAEAAVRNQIERLTADDVLLAVSKYGSGYSDDPTEIATSVAYDAVSLAADRAAEAVEAEDRNLAEAIQHWFG